MKRKTVISFAVTCLLMVSSLFVPAAIFGGTEITAYAASASESVVKLDSSTIDYTSISDECIQIPCESLGGIYFLNEEDLVFYSLSTGKTTSVYNFALSGSYINDSYAANNKLYVLHNNYMKNQFVITVYNLLNKKVETTFSIENGASAIGADSSGRIYLGSSDKMYLYSATGTLLSEVNVASAVFDFGAFDSTNGNFYFEGYYNWVYWGYDHDMRALRVGNVKNNTLSIEEVPLFLISQKYWYERQTPMDLLNNRYLCVESIFNSGLYILDSNKINFNDLDNTDSTFLERDEQTNNFDFTASIGSRSVYLDSTKNIVTFIDNNTLAEVNPATGEIMAEVTPAHPVFSLMKYGDKILAVEKDNDEFYLETLQWKHATSVSITGSSSTVKIGSTLQLTATTNGTLNEDFTWTSSDPKVASVNQSGKVFGWSAGSATITATTKQGLKATYKVTVSSGLPVQNPSKVATTTTGTKSNNISANNYSTWSSVVNSYITQNSDGTISRVEFISGKVVVETYSADGSTLKSTKTLSAELPLFGGFYSGSSNYYLVFGQKNPSDSDSVEVLRVVKYSKSWSRVSSVSVKGANTSIPFDAGSLRMTETAGKLYIHTCHEMYTSDDGYNHQANMTFVINESSMQVVDSYSDVMNIAQAGYVSHSFNQFVQTDGQYVYRVDHGDANPRAISITRCDVNGKITSVKYTLPISLSKVTGYNPTGASVGGFELSSKNALIAGNAVDYTKSNISYNSIRNIFVSITDKELNSSKVVWITKYTDSQKITVRTPQLIKIGDDQFLLMWEEYNGATDKTYAKAVTIDDNGNLTSDIILTSTRLSDCQPIKCSDGVIRWYVTENSSPTIYALNPYNLKQAQGSEYKLSTPQVSALENVNSGVKITWGKVTGAEKYRVFYKTENGSWTNIADTTSTSYTWTGAKSGTKYYFTVRCISSDGKNYTSAYDTVGKSITYIAAPQITSLTSELTGIQVNWGSVAGAAKYRVYYKTGDGSWVSLGDTTATSYTWTGANSGTKYAFTVRCVSSDGKSFTSGYDTTGKTITYIAAPKVSSVSLTTTGVQITWGKVTGAEKYRVYYRTENGNWTNIADTTSTSYTWTGAKSGTKYYFTVRCISSDGKNYTSAYDTVGKSMTYVAAPKISSASLTATGIQISWGSVAGAEKYRLYYKTDNGSWIGITDTASTSYTWTGAKSGTKYTFTVRCISADGNDFTSGYDTTGKTITYIAAPQISSVAVTATGVQITWGKVTGAAKYRVFYKTGSGNWISLGDTTATSYTWTGAKGGSDYTFTVRCVSSDGKTFTSAYDAVGKSLKYLAIPKASSVIPTETGIKISWGSVAGAEKYRLYYKTNSVGWTGITDTTSTSFIWTGAKSGSKYTFTVRCISADGKSYTSYYDTVGKSLAYVAAPQISSVGSTATGIQITWGKVAGAAKYRVFYKTGSGSWTGLGDTTATSYTWTGAKSGTKYTFTIRCVSSDGKSFTSSYDSAGKSLAYVAAPKISSATLTATGVQISWGSVAGAEKYRLYYKTDSVGWTGIPDTTSTSYTWTGAKSGTKYTFTVRCVSSDGKSYTSNFDATGKTVTYIAAPQISSISNATAGIQIAWGKVTGAAKYRVFRKTGNGSWVAVGDTTSTSFVDKTAVKGTKYTYTVRCISSDGKTYTSSYDSVGKTITR